METVRTIAVIGAAGKTGSTIVRALAKNRYRLLLMADEPEKVNGLKAELESQMTNADIWTMECEREASWEADIIILAIPRSAQKDVAEKIREVATRKVVIAVFTPEAPDHCDFSRTSPKSAAEELQGLLPYSGVVMMFNSALAGAPTPAELFIAGNTGDAVSTVADLARSADLNPVIVGDLTTGRTLEKTCVKLRIPREGGSPLQNNKS